jgi:hypothetical protein
MRRGHAAIYVTAARQIHRGCTAEVRQRRAHPPRYDSLLIPPPCQCEYSLSIVSSYLVLFHAASPAWTTQPAPPGGCAADSHANCMQQQQQQNRAPPPTTAAAYTATDLVAFRHHKLIESSVSYMYKNEYNCINGRTPSNIQHAATCNIKHTQHNRGSTQRRWVVRRARSHAAHSPCTWPQRRPLVAPRLRRPGYRRGLASAGRSGHQGAYACTSE